MDEKEGKIFVNRALRMPHTANLTMTVLEQRMRKNRLPMTIL
jgi:hypothetical protein